VYGGVAATVASTRRLTGVSANAERWMLRVTGPALMAGAVLTLVFGWRPVQAQPVAPVMSTAAAPSSSTAHAGKNDFNILGRHWVTPHGRRSERADRPDRAARSAACHTLAARSIAKACLATKASMVCSPRSTAFAPPPATNVISEMPMMPKISRRYCVAISRSRMGEPSP
jgi:hypothetical protein